MQEAALRFHLAEQRRRRIWGENVECGAFQAILLDPISGSREDIFAVVIETKDKGTIHLDTVAMEYPDTAGVIRGSRRFLFRFAEVLVPQRLEADKDAGASPEGHVPDQTWVVGDIDRDSGAPDLVERSQSATKGA